MPSEIQQPRRGFLGRAVDAMAAPFRFRDPLEDAKVELTYGITIIPAHGRFKYNVADPRNPEPAKKTIDGSELRIGRGERKAALRKAQEIIQAEVRANSRGGLFDWLGGVPLAEWKGIIDGKTRELYLRNVERSAPTNKIQELKERYAALDYTTFLARKPVEELLPMLADPNDRREQILNNMARMLIWVRREALKELRITENSVTQCFFDEAANRIGGELKP